MAIKNYTSSVSAFSSLGEIQAALAGHGARQIMVDYDDKGQPVGVTFSIDTPVGRRGFILTASAVCPDMPVHCQKETCADGPCKAYFGTDAREFGKTVFLSREEAKRRLKGETEK